MQFRILGPVEVQDERTGLRILPTGAKQRALLGALVVKAGHSVSVHRLIDELWGEHPPANAANALQAHVTRLRRLLSGPDGCPDPAPGPGSVSGQGPDGEQHPWIVTRSLGYALQLDPHDTDAARFHHLTARGRQALLHDPGQAVDLLRRAQSLWRGPALEGSVLGDICAVESAQLEEHRLAALEMMYDACLRTGRHGEIIGELEELTADHPMRERFYDLLMVAFYRCGRQAEALGVYDRARKRLVHELGIEPGPALRGLMEAILHHDPVLSTAGAARPADTAGPPATTTSGSAAGTESGATALTLGDEIARLHRRIEGLQLQQERLLHRFEALTASAARRVAGGQGAG
ncbi:AfsR/SARP family transcriptional regulator (plasmid) [Streptomyces sp. NBC_01387]|uniref:AfsR/SARP family transcriptional regulator n=1 Tax=unclassified Streptomyces TaxID=2593676 RepID=UPI002024F14E|nr:MULTISPECIES: AfsR/SARP family transcriptional regulator [unclassified Streptomyces]MCX4554448.1 AfsR/SARP family transcriptional regulator [Streptomyces sp. NBC_01500]WSC25168.1 AfsR/SARP family transcriptional regulator [Streptomyces sp. NBC_01766]WSV58950.1 AfsR/SARP family transcriptional regulator [Streptomyces sp. NBC_01014]